MEWEVCKTLQVTFTMEEVRMLLEVLADKKVVAIVDKDYGGDWLGVVTQLRTILVNT